ncbi:hypothetical protein Bca4012_075957 [Brassica carinata]
MDTVQGGDLVNQLDPTEVLPSNRAEHTARVIPSDHSIHTDHVFPSDRADQTVRTVPSDHPTVPHVLSTVSTHRCPERSSDYNHDLAIELIDPYHFFPKKFNIIRLIVEPESSWEEKNPKMAADSPLWTFWCAPRVPKAVLTFLLQC